MQFDKLIYILIQGFTLGFGPCLLICAPILLPYIAATQKGIWQGLKTTLIFSLTRMAIYTFLGAVFGYVGFILMNFYSATNLKSIIWSMGALFIVALGILIVLGKQVKNPFCHYLNKHTLDHSFKSVVFLGIIIGFSPCLPLLGILTEIALFSDSMWVGAFYAFAFSLGTVFSPLLVLGAAAGYLPQKLFVSPKLFRWFQIVCGGLLVGVGGYILLQLAPSILRTYLF